MPIITFQGLSRSAVEKYYGKVEELESLISASRDNIFFVFNENVKLINQVRSAYIQVEWLGRHDKEQILVDHLKQHFASEVDKLAVFFTEVNGKLFINENRVG